MGEIIDWGQYVLVRGLVRRVMAPMGLGICVDKSNGSCVGWMMELVLHNILVDGASPRRRILLMEDY